MKKVTFWLMAVAMVVFVIAWGVMGVKIFNHEYEILIEAYTALICWVVLLVCIVIRRFSDRCPHCGKPRSSRGKYCSYCGKEIEK